MSDCVHISGLTRVRKREREGMKWILVEVWTASKRITVKRASALFIININININIII